VGVWMTGRSWRATWGSRLCVSRGSFLRNRRRTRKGRSRGTVVGRSSRAHSGGGHVGRPGGALARSARAEFQLQLLNTTVHQLVGSNYQHVVHTLHNYSLLIRGLD